MTIGIRSSIENVMSGSMKSFPQPSARRNLESPNAGITRTKQHPGKAVPRNAHSIDSSTTFKK
ncbi:unnamed protein product, partial [Darwinula stevensoni]